MPVSATTGVPARRAQGITIDVVRLRQVGVDVPAGGRALRVPRAQPVGIPAGALARYRTGPQPYGPVGFRRRAPAPSQPAPGAALQRGRATGDVSGFSGGTAGVPS